ncbi:hypothetical protein [Ilumatobacter sp.]|uniref:hypothetical protein n=1 Tax=Ilumatobacter sp. TaxID=1967498 RepID=UPI003C4AF0B8
MILAIDGTEVVGYVASALVVLALTMRSIVRLRILSLCGSITFFIYGTLIESIPIMITNGCIAAINLWYLRREFLVRMSDRQDIGASQIRSDSPFLLDFIEYHADDIHRFQPAFTMPTDTDVMSLVLTRDGLPAGLLVGRRIGDTLRIDLDYVMREHRDSRLGQWLFGPGAEVFRTAGLTCLRADATTDDHDRYLQRVGFERTVGNDSHFELTL